LPSTIDIELRAHGTHDSVAGIDVERTFAFVRHFEQSFATNQPYKPSMIAVLHFDLRVGVERDQRAVVQQHRALFADLGFITLRPQHEPGQRNGAAQDRQAGS
jgi:hypothetical protein